MQKKKAALWKILPGIMLLVCLYILLGGCSSADSSSATDRTAVTYDTASENVKAVVDLIYDHERVWSDNVECIGFTTNNGAPAFVAREFTSVVTVHWYKFNVNAQTFVDDGQLTMTSAGSLMYEKNWGSAMSEQTKKDVLAQEYANFLAE